MPGFVAHLVLRGKVGQTSSTKSVTIPANNGFTWAWNFTKALVKGPSTGPGSCLGVFTGTVTAPLDKLQSGSGARCPSARACGECFREPTRRGPVLTVHSGKTIWLVAASECGSGRNTALGISTKRKELRFLCVLKERGTYSDRYETRFDSDYDAPGMRGTAFGMLIGSDLGVSVLERRIRRYRN
jgi:hypothetical protein